MIKFLTALVLFTAFNVYAECKHLYPTNPPVSKEAATELCNSFFVIVYDEKNNRPIYVSERLARSAVKVKRVNSFREDKRLKNGPTNLDYKNSGFDRGHLSPAADAISEEQMKETFLLSNMTPQAPGLNRAAWRELEEKIRDEIDLLNQTVFVVTIPIYNNPKYIGRLPVPSGYWKIVIIGNTEKYYFAENTNTAIVQQISKVNWRKLKPFK